MNEIHLDDVVERINRAFGEDLPLTAGTSGEAEREALQRALDNREFDAWMQDQINRQVIRDYLANATSLPIPIGNLETCSAALKNQAKRKRTFSKP